MQSIILDGVLSVYNGEVFYSASIPEVNNDELRELQPLQSRRYINRAIVPLSAFKGSQPQLMINDTVTAEMILFLRYANKRSPMRMTTNIRYEQCDIFLTIVYADEHEKRLLTKFWDFTRTYNPFMYPRMNNNLKEYLEKTLDKTVGKAEYFKLRKSDDYIERGNYGR